MDPPLPVGQPGSDAATRRRAFRAFVRAHHPDVGGDPAVFAATVAAYRAWQRGQRPPPAGTVTVYRRGSWLTQLRRHWRRRQARRRHPRVR